MVKTQVGFFTGTFMLIAKYRYLVVLLYIEESYVIAAVANARWFRGITEVMQAHSTAEWEMRAYRRGFLR